MNKRFLLPLIISFIIIFKFPTIAFSQWGGTYTCNWGGTANGCILVQDNCTDGCYVPPGDPCESFLESTCQNLSQSCFCPMQPPGEHAIDWYNLYRAVQPLGTGEFTMSYRTTPATIINALVGYIFPIAGLLLLLYLIYGGYMFMTSAGDPQKAQNAKGVITMALIGFTIIFTSYWIVQIAGYVLGLGDITSIF